MSAAPPNLSSLSAKVNKKRKRQAEEAPKEDKAAPAKSTSNNTSEAAERPRKKKKKNSKSKQKQQKQKEQDEDPKQQERKGGIDESIGKMDGRLLADHFAQKAKRHNKDLTAVELSDLSVPGMLSRLAQSQVQFN